MNIYFGQGITGHIFRASVHTAQSGILSVVQKIFEQVMLDHVQNQIAGKTLDCYRARVFDAEVAEEDLSKRLLHSSLSMALIASFVGLKWPL